MTAESRRTTRRETNAGLRIVIETSEFSGQADNLSLNGVFFFSNEKVRVRVHVEEEGVLKSYNGAIVRVQQMSEQETGFAIEFDAT